MLDLKKAYAIAGWMSETELNWLAQEAQKHKYIVEIGSHLGRSTRALADNTPGKVVAIDDWKGPRDVGMEEGNFFPGFCHNMADVLGTKLQAIRTDFKNLADVKLEEEPDMIFLDGEHTYKEVLRDLLWARSKMKHGLLCGHDFEYQEVVYALAAFLAETDMVPSVGAALRTSIWWVKVE